MVICGGYEGAMAAVSRGAREAGGEAEGVLCRAFGQRRPNEHLTRRVWTSSLMERMRILLESADGYVALDPKAGTLAEVITLLAMAKSGFVRRGPLTLVGENWPRVLGVLGETGILEPDLLKWPLCLSDPAEAVAAISEGLGAENEAHG